MSEARQRVPAKAVPVVLDPAWTLQVALRQMVRGCLDHLRANDGGAASSRDSEYLHQTRVALRRMRSALRLQLPADAAVIALRAELKWLAGSLGTARDWDVLLEDILRPMARAYASAAPAADFTRLMNAARRRRTDARRAARAALSSERYAALLQALKNWLGAPFASDPAVDALPQFAARIVRRRHKRLLRDAAGFMQQSPAQRHQVRIDTKRLRYMVEFFLSLFPGKSVNLYRRELAALQDSLGALNDAATAARLLEGLPGADVPAPFIRGWLAARETDSLGAVEAALARLAKCGRFWKSAG